MQYEDYQTMGGDQYDHIKFSKPQNFNYTCGKYLLHLWKNYTFVTLMGIPVWEIFLLRLWEILLHLWENLLHLWELLHLKKFITLVGPTGLL